MVKNKFLKNIIIVIIIIIIPLLLVNNFTKNSNNQSKNISNKGLNIEINKSRENIIKSTFYNYVKCFYLLGKAQNYYKQIINNNNKILNEYNKAYKANLNYRLTTYKKISSYINFADISLNKEIQKLKVIKNIVMTHKYNYFNYIHKYNLTIPNIFLNTNYQNASFKNIQNYGSSIIKQQDSFNSILLNTEDNITGIQSTYKLMTVSSKIFLSHLKFNYNLIYYFSTFLNELSNTINIHNKINDSNSLLNNFNPPFIPSGKTNNNPHFILPSSLLTKAYSVNKINTDVFYGIFGIIGLVGIGIFTWIGVKKIKKYRRVERVKRKINVYRQSENFEDSSEETEFSHLNTVNVGYNAHVNVEARNEARKNALIGEVKDNARMKEKKWEVYEGHVLYPNVSTETRVMRFVTNKEDVHVSTIYKNTTILIKVRGRDEWVYFDFNHRGELKFKTIDGVNVLPTSGFNYIIVKKEEFGFLLNHLEIPFFAQSNQINATVIKMEESKFRVLFSDIVKM